MKDPTMMTMGHRHDRRRARPEGRPVASTARSFIYLDPETDNDALRTRLLGACAGHDYFTSMPATTSPGSSPTT